MNFGRSLTAEVIFFAVSYGFLVEKCVVFQSHLLIKDISNNE